MSRFSAQSAAPLLSGATLCALGAAAVLAMTACAGPTATAATAVDQAPPTPADARAIVQLADIAPRTAEIDGPPTGTDCWAPSDSPLERTDAGGDTGFRVLCRVHFVEAGTDRYRDMICIGDLAENPVADHCYRWAYYTGMPEFEDQKAYAAPSA